MPAFFDEGPEGLWGLLEVDALHWRPPAVLPEDWQHAVEIGLVVFDTNVFGADDTSKRTTTPVSSVKTRACGVEQKVESTSEPLLPLLAVTDRD